MRGFGHAEAPADGEQEDVLVKTVEAPQQRQQQVAHHHPGAGAQSGQGEQYGQYPPRRFALLRAAAGHQQHQSDDGEEVLQQQQADHHLADVSVVQHGGGQQLDTDDGRGKHHRHADDCRLDAAVDKEPGHREGQCEEDSRAGQAHHGRFAQCGDQRLRLHIQPEQKKQKNNADMADVSEEL